MQEFRNKNSGHTKLRHTGSTWALSLIGLLCSALSTSHANPFDFFENFQSIEVVTEANFGPDPLDQILAKIRVIRHPVDPFGMADVDFAQAPRGLADTLAALIKRKAYERLRD